MTKRQAQFLAGVVLSLILVAVLFRKTDWARVFLTIKSIDAGWLLASQVFLWLAIFCRTFRWAAIVRSSEAARFRALFSATQIGLFANLFLPGRMGEVIRAALLSRLAAIPLTRTAMFVFADRLTDLAGLAVVLLVCVCGYHPDSAIRLPAELSGTLIPADSVIRSAYATGGVFVVAAAVLILLGRHWQPLQRLLERVTARVWPGFSVRMGQTVEHLGAGLGVFRQVRRLLLAVLYSVATWGSYVAGVACILRAFHLPFPWYAPFAVQAFTAAAIALPAAPGFIGQFHFGVIMGLALTMPGTDFSTAQAIALITHVLFLAPVTISGIYCLLQEGQSLLGLLPLSKAARHPNRVAGQSRMSDGPD